MEVGLTLDLEIQEGTLKLSLVDCSCVVKEISIILDGGTSWLYQGYAFHVSSLSLKKNFFFFSFFCFFLFLLATSGVTY